MSMFAWSDTYSIGVAEIDAQHRRLFSLADQLHSAMASGKGKAVLEQVLQSLISYTKTHFAAEERIMRDCAYSDLAAHKAQHDQLTQRVLNLQSEFRAGKMLLTLDVLEFLKNWLQMHIAGCDRKYAPFVGKKAAK
jgi:hemerythrin